ncbi:MAG TPA: sigma-70 family RNA polymerase sigma factor, partial [Polyangiaceae bacterium]|nr:sigma-70 family RNA polymerase sigma factor [Polyangiaceae bacterium]
LARRGAAGDHGATQSLLTMLWPSIARVVAGVLGSWHPDLDDTVQQSMLALAHALPSFRGECHPAGFGCRIAFRTACRARRRWQHDRARRDELEDVPESELAESPGDLAEAEQRRRILRELLASLPEEQAETLALRSVMGWSLEEVARATGAPLNTVRSRVRLAKEALRRRIEARPELAAEVSLDP